MAHSDFTTIYQRYQTQYQQAVNAKQTHGLNEHQYIQLAIAAEALHYQEAIYMKIEQLEKDCQQLIANHQTDEQKREHQQQQIAKRFEEILKSR